MKISVPILFILLICYGHLYAQSLYFEINKDRLTPNAVVASIDKISITAEEFFYNYEFGPSFPKRQKRSKEIHLNFMINEKLLALEGYKLGMLEKDVTESIYNDIIADLATEELFKNEILSQIEITAGEIDEVVNNKNTELKIRWIYNSDEKTIREYYYIIDDQTLFDSLFNDQINDSVFSDQRQMKISMFNLKKKNPILANIVDTMEVGKISPPIDTPEGWYIIKFDNKTLSVITTESEINKLRKEAHESITKSKMDSLSDSYVNKVLFENHPIIKRDAFNILRSYLGKYILQKEKFNEWQLDQKLEIALNNLGISKKDNYPGIVLIESTDTNFILDDFMYWYINRQLYIKFIKSDLSEFSKSLENLIWQMLRDKLLTKVAEENNYFENEWVKQQSKWWKDKVVYSALRNEYVNALTIDNNEVSSNDQEESNSEKKSRELSKKLLHKILELKKKHKININKDVLDKIIVSSKDDRKAIEFYSVKKGGLIPRQPYPTIDNEWVNWE